jgi:hypothetical protein
MCAKEFAVSRARHDKSIWKFFFPFSYFLGGSTFHDRIRVEPEVNSEHGLKMENITKMCYIFTPFGTEQECQMVYELRVK